MSARRSPGGSPRPLRLGFAGLGWIGRTRLDAIAAAPGVQVAALMDSDATRIDAAAAVHRDALCTDELGALLDAGVDGVVIATPSGCHAPQAITCLERGVAVFCQKPAGLDAAETRAVVGAAAAANRLLHVDYCYRHLRGMAELRSRIRDGELGSLLAMDLTFHNAYGPDQAWCRDRALAGGGCLLDLGVHLIDLALWLEGEHAFTVVDSARYASGRRLAPGDAQLEDLAFVTLCRDDGAIVRLACAWHAQAGCDAIIGARLFGTRGGAVLGNVGGSFHDFTVDVVHGTATERLGAPPDRWGPRALEAWCDRLAADRSFDPAALQFERVAALVDAAYAA